MSVFNYHHSLNFLGFYNMRFVNFVKASGNPNLTSHALKLILVYDTTSNYTTRFYITA